MDSSNRSLNEVRARWDITDLDTGENRFQHTITLRLNDLELEENKLSLQITELRADIGNLEELAVGVVNEQVENLIEGDPTIVMLTQRIATIEMDLAGKLTKFGENHREVREQQELLNETRLRRQIRRADIAEQTRQANFKNAQDRLVTLQKRHEDLSRLRQEADAKKRDLDMARIQYAERMVIRDER